MTTTSASGTSLGEFLENARQPGRSSPFAEQAERFQQFIDESMAAGPDAPAVWPKIGRASCRERVLL